MAQRRVVSLAVNASAKAAGKAKLMAQTVETIEMKIVYL
jgi:hypothetical protein